MNIKRTIAGDQSKNLNKKEKYDNLGQHEVSRRVN